MGGALKAAPYAAMVMDARTGEVLHSRNADTRLHPASLTKMMTLYIAFEAVRLGEITLDTPVRISQHAASEPPSRLGLRAGSTIRFRYLIRAAAIRSANDAATAIGEAISGSEAAFAARMTRTAQALGMTRTTFRNAHGLTQDGHLSTASDMTIMGRRLFYDYPQYYNIFSRRQDDAGIATIRNTNRALLDAYRGADGIKTGYTRAAGFNLVASAERGNVRVIATVFGGQSTAWRNQRIMELMDMGFARAPARATERRPSLPVYGPSGGSGSGGAVLTSGIVSQSLRPMPRPGATQEPRAPEPALLAAIEEAVGQAIQAAATEPEAQPQAAPEPANTTANVPPSPDTQPMPRPQAQAQVEAAETQSQPIPPRPADEPAPIIVAGPLEPEVITRASSSGSRLFGVSLGPQPSHHAAERLLLRTALSEIGTFDQALRRVVQRSGGYEARFQGLTEDQATRACARLSARAIPCEPFGPAS
ncbi:serine hydrolase [Roseicyclus sp.]|uniref:D-alanyl-D-alanine carboxypeptidase family protein n=1 Tax=Roseicyclus sp. TaxID=1914329 RepID=UPI003F6C80C4